MTIRISRATLVGLALVALAILGLALPMPGDRNSSPTPISADSPTAANVQEQHSDSTGDGRCACPRATGCEILGRYEVGSAAAKDRGFVQFTVERGVVSCDPEDMDCAFRGAPKTATIVETTDACGLWGNFLLLDAAHVYIQRPQSIGDRGGPGWALVALDGADPGTYEPLPRGFGRDASHVYDHGELLYEADVRTFEVLQCSDCLACDATQCW